MAGDDPRPGGPLHCYIGSADIEYFYLINYTPGVIGSPDEAVSFRFFWSINSINMAFR